MDFNTYSGHLDYIKRSLLTQISSQFQYTNWSDEFCREDLRRTILRTQAAISLSQGTTPEEKEAYKELNMGRWYTEEELQGFIKPEQLLPLPNKLEQYLVKDDYFKFGFGNWDGGLILIPIWLLPFLNPNEKVRSIMGDETTIKEADNDHRGGFTAYGFLDLKHDYKEEN